MRADTNNISARAKSIDMSHNSSWQLTFDSMQCNVCAGYRQEYNKLNGSRQFVSTYFLMKSSRRTPLIKCSLFPYRKISRQMSGPQKAVSSLKMALNVLCYMHLQFYVSVPECLAQNIYYLKM